MDIVETAQDKCPVPSEAAGYSLADNRTVQVSVGRQAGFRENQLLDDVQTTEKGNGGMRNREANLLPKCKTYYFFLPIENKRLTKNVSLIGNDVETSELLHSGMFCTNQKNAFLMCKDSIFFLKHAFAILLFAFYIWLYHINTPRIV